MSYCGVDGYNKTLTGEVAPTISGTASDFHHVHGVLWRGHKTVYSSDSAGNQVFNCLAAVEYKGVQAQKDKGGGEMVFLSGSNAKVSESKEG